MAKATCSIEPCVKTARCRGWCGAHYERWRKHGDPNITLAPVAPPRPPRTQRDTCDVDGCDVRPLAHNLCNTHYRKMVKYGDPLADGRRQRAFCMVDECSRAVQGHGLCPPHYRRWRLYGDPVGGRATYVVCQADGCETKPRSATSEWCHRHYSRLHRNGTLTLTVSTWDQPRSQSCAYCSVDISTANVTARKYCSPRCQTRAIRGVPLEPGQCIDCQGALPPGSRADRQYCPPCYRDRLLADSRDRKHRRRAITRAADAERIDSREIYERDGWRCGLCRRKVNAKLKHPNLRSASLDHIVPLARGGRHVRTNVHLAHLGCNLAKNANGDGEQLLLIG